MSKLNVTNEPNQPADPEETPVPIKKFRELTTRYSQALQDDGPVALASELRTTMLYQVHKHLLDKLAKSSEPDVVQDTTKLGDLTIDSQYREEGVEYVPTPHRVVGGRARCANRDSSLLRARVRPAADPAF